MFEVVVCSCRPLLPFARRRLVLALYRPQSMVEEAELLGWVIVTTSLLVVVVVLLYERIGNLLAAIQWRYQDQECASCHKETQTSGALVSFLVCEVLVRLL